MNTFSNTPVSARTTAVAPFIGEHVSFPTFGSGWNYIGEAADTTDVASIISISQTNADANLRLHRPTDRTITKMITIANTGSEQFLFKCYGAIISNGVLIPSGGGVSLLWDGGVQSYILLGGSYTFPQ